MGDEKGSSIAMFRLPPEEIDKRPMRLRTMHRLFGVTEGKRCRTCAHLTYVQWAKKYYKCEIFGTEGRSKASTDWATTWPACGQWQKKEGK